MPSVDAGVSIAYERHGSGPPLVLLHGGWLDRSLWAPQVDRLAGDRTVVAVDLRDHGDSGRADGRYRVADLAEDVGVLLDDLSLDRPVVCGLSLGSLVAQRLLADRPGLLGGVVLAGAPTSIPPVPFAEATKSVAPLAATRLAVRTLGVRVAFRQLLATVESVEGRWLATTDAARAYALDAVDRFEPARFLRVLSAIYRFAPVDLPGAAPPALVVHGDREARPVVAQSRRLARRLDAERVVVDGAGHLVNRDRPAAFADAVERFLAERRRR